MKFIETPLKGAFVVDLDPIWDHRGFFARSWCQREFQQKGLKESFVQGNIAMTSKKGTIRGLHYQTGLDQEVKLVRCIRGGIYDVIIDLRHGSQTFEQWTSVVLTDQNRSMLYIPEGFAQGYQTLEDETEVMYMVSEFYAPQSEVGIRWNDSYFDIEWPQTRAPILSDKDKNCPDYGPVVKEMLARSRD